MKEYSLESGNLVPDHCSKYSELGMGRVMSESDTDLDMELIPISRHVFVTLPNCTYSVHVVQERSAGSHQDLVPESQVQVLHIDCPSAHACRAD